MEILFFGLVALGILGMATIAPILALRNMSRIRRLEQSLEALAKRLTRAEAGAPEGVADAVQATGPQAAVASAPGVPVGGPAKQAAAADATARVEGPVETTSPTVPPPAAGARPQPAEVPPAAAAQATPPPQPSPAKQLDLESLIAGRWLNRLGVVAVMLAAAFFLKYAFDNDWVGPAARVVIGKVIGAGLLLASQWLLGKGYRYFSEGIAALGGGVLFLSIYAAWGFYQLVPQGVAFAGLVLVTIALAGLALVRDSQRLAVLALAAGLWVPGLLSTGVDRQVALFGYIAVLLACFLVLAWRQGWRWIAPLALFGVLLYYIGWYDRFYTEEKLVRTWFFASLLFGEIGVYLALREWRGRRLHQLELLLVVVNALWFGVALHAMLYDDHRWWLTAAVLVLAGLYLAAGRPAKPSQGEEPAAGRLVHAGLALVFATAAIPIRLEGEWITITWAVEAAVLVWAGFRADVQALRAAGLVLFVGVLGLLRGQAGAIERLLLNERFASFAVTVAALVVSVRWAGARESRLETAERRMFGAAAVAANLIAVWALSEEIWYFLGRQRMGLDPSLAQQMGLSLLWAVAASLMILLGVRKEEAALRWQGLSLLGLAVAKVFLYDLSFLERAYRIASFLVLGIVLLLVSFWYQRTASESAASDDEETSGGDPS